MKGLYNQGMKMLVVTLTFCIIVSGVQSLPVYPPATVPGYIDPYSVPSGYPALDPYAANTVYSNPYATVDPYNPQVLVYDPYSSLNAQPYPAVDPYDPYFSLNAYQLPQAQSYPAIDPYAPPLQPSAYPGPSPAYPTTIELYSPSVPQNYPVAPVYQQNILQSAIDAYTAITDHTLDFRKHCGVIQATNDDIYSSSVPGTVNDVLPYGAAGWLALIVDLDTQSVACLGTVIHSEYVLTTTSCITKPAGRYIVVKDWDILTRYNEYESYKSYADPVCTAWPLTVDNSTGQSMYAVGNQYNSELTLLVGPLEEHHSEYPADVTLCLPSDSSVLPYGNVPYGNVAPPYGNMPQPIPSPYSPYPQIPYSNPYLPTGECWVAGYRSSPTAVLQNHPPSLQLNNYPPQQQPIGQGYYNALDNSKVPRKALVRQIQCPAGYPSPGSDDACFVGINGYDACVADVGTAVYCIIDDSPNPYNSGFANDPTSDHGQIAQGLVSASPQPSLPITQQQPIQVQQSQQMQSRRRAILYAVVKAPTTACMAPSPAAYPPNVQQQSNYIVGSRINPSIRAALQDLMWQTGYDLSCPTERVSNIYPNPLAPVTLPYQPSSSIQPYIYDPSLLMPSSYQQLNPLYPQPNPLYPQQNPLYPQPNPLYPQQNPLYPQQNPLYPQPNPLYPQPTPILTPYPQDIYTG